MGKIVPGFPLSESQLRQPTVSDRYRIERELGRGATATVYLARDLQHDRPVAIKVLYPELAQYRMPVARSDIEPLPGAMEIRREF
jgi:serine/threonine protein kinase